MIKVPKYCASCGGPLVRVNEEYGDFDPFTGSRKTRWALICERNFKALERDEHSRFIRGILGWYDDNEPEAGYAITPSSQRVLRSADEQTHDGGVQV